MGKPSPPVRLEPGMNPEPSLHPDVSLCSSQGSNQRLQCGGKEGALASVRPIGISHSRPRLTAARGCSCRYVSLSGSLAPLVISFYDMLLSSPYSICHLVISASLRVSTFERNGGLHSVTPRSPSERSE
ncbi:hypothetical protein Hanom_Chr06g00556841 [Helianthus anomalus]